MQWQQAWGEVGDFKSDLGRSQRTRLGTWLEVEVEGREMPSPLAFVAGELVDSDGG